ncbi:MAG: LemA family protein [Paludibacteraceae bacterium]|nr:LemA family protein [Paludibacteraceae bacterium]
MKKSTILLLAGLAVVALWFIYTRNGFVSQDENVNKAWANVQTQYQRRLDLIGNLVNTVKGYAKHEKETFESITNARAKVSSAININADDLSEEKLAEVQKQLSEASAQMNSGLSRLIAVSESYPELKASEQFKELQAQLEGTENRIAEARNKFNSAVQEYNVQVRLFPGNLVASICGYSAKAMFQADAGAEHAPTVNFD